MKVKQHTGGLREKSPCFGLICKKEIAPDIRGYGIWSRAFYPVEFSPL
jgi:hypothetical protein